MNCIFQKMGDNLVCVNCGYETPYKEYSDGIVRTCKKPKSSFMTKFKSGTIEIVKQGKAAIEGDLRSEKDVMQERLDICNDCEFFKHNFCQKCGCNLSFKTRLKHANCPIGKW